MDTVTVIVKDLFVNNETCTIYFKEAIKGIVKEGDKFIDSKTDHLTFANKQLNAAIRSIVEDAKILFQRNGNKSLSGNQISAVLCGSIMTLDRSAHKKGEEYIDDDGVINAYNHDGYNKQILDIKISRMAIAALQQITIQAMLG